MIDDALNDPGDAANQPGGATNQRGGAASGCGCGCGPSGTTSQAIRSMIEQIEAGSLQLPDPEFRSDDQRVLAAMMHVVREYQVPRSCFIDYVESRCADRSVVRYPTWSRLRDHCDGTEGSIARAMSCVMGLTHSDGPRYAASLGRAVRLAQIVRDVKDDFDRGRIYLPLEDMARLRYSERDLAGGIVNDSFRELIRFQVDRARAMCDEAAGGLRWLAGDGSRLAAAMVVAMNEAVLDAVESARFDVLTRRTELNWRRKAAIAPRAWNLARRG